MGGATRIARDELATELGKCCFPDINFKAFIDSIPKASLPPTLVKSPPDIAMDSKKLEEVTGIKATGIADFIQEIYQ